MQRSDLIEITAEFQAILWIYPIFHPDCHGSDQIGNFQPIMPFFSNYSGILNNRPHGCYIDNILRNCRRGFIPRSSKWPPRNRGINPLLQFSRSPSHENFLVSYYYPSAFIFEAKPHFILILSDDPGYGDLSCYFFHLFSGIWCFMVTCIADRINRPLSSRV